MTEVKKRLLSGMRPTGRLHLGHSRVVQNWIDLADEYEAYYFTADWHAITTAWDSTDMLRENKRQIVIELKYVDGKSVIEGIERVSKCSCRVHCGSREIPRVRNGLGIVVLSTPKGIMSGRKAVKENVGGEILCRVW